MNTQEIQKTLENIRSLCVNIEKAFGFFHDDETIVIHLDEK